MRPYLELQCLDCDNLYPADIGDCPQCGSANVSFEYTTPGGGLVRIGAKHAH